LIIYSILKGRKVPYIESRRRAEIAYTLPSDITTGELNFILSDLVDQFVGLVPNYDKLNSAIGVLECVIQEVYRKIVVPYELGKELTNGPVFMERE
jgi:hypothetical protein